MLTCLQICHNTNSILSLTNQSLQVAGCLFTELGLRRSERETQTHLQQLMLMLAHPWSRHKGSHQVPALRTSSLSLKLLTVTVSLSTPLVALSFHNRLYLRTWAWEMWMTAMRSKISMTILFGETIREQCVLLNPYPTAINQLL